MYRILLNVTRLFIFLFLSIVFIDGLLVVCVSVYGIILGYSENLYNKYFFLGQCFKNEI